MTNGNVLNLWRYDKFLRHLEQHHVHNDELDFSDNGLVSLFSFGFFSCTILHLSSSIIPTLHHFVLTTQSYSFSESCSTPKLCKCGIPRLTNSFLKFFAQALLDTPFMVVAHVLIYLPVCLFPLPIH